MAAPPRPRIRVLHVIASSAFGGAERVVATLLQTTDRDRFDVSIACHGRGPMLAEYREAVDEVWPCDLPTMFRPGAARWLADLMRHLQVEIVHTHLWSADLLGGMAARLAGVAVRVATVHGGYFQRVDERGMRAARKACLSRTYRSTYAMFDRVIAVSEDVAEDLSRRAGVRVPASKISVVRNGIDVPSNVRPRPGLREELGIPARAPLVTTVANFAPMKGHRYLVAAMPHVLAASPQAMFLLVGRGSELEVIRNVVERAGLASRVRFAGARDDAVEIMANSSVVVLPSVAAEGIPITILEALGAGRPVVSTRIGGIPEVIDDGVTGVLVSPRDPRALADAINRVLSDDAAAARMAERGCRLVQSKFSAERMVREVEQLYGELLAMKPSVRQHTGVAYR